MWLMATGRREQQRTLALDVWRLWTDKRFDVDEFIRTGKIETRRTWASPHNPLVERELERIQEAQRTGTRWVPLDVIERTNSHGEPI